MGFEGYSSVLFLEIQEIEISTVNANLIVAAE